LGYPKSTWGRQAPPKAITYATYFVLQPPSAAVATSGRDVPSGYPKSAWGRQAPPKAITYATYFVLQPPSSAAKLLKPLADIIYLDYRLTFLVIETRTGVLILSPIFN
jgi:hypothetical protein